VTGDEHRSVQPGNAKRAPVPGWVFDGLSQGT